MTDDHNGHEVADSGRRLSVPAVDRRDFLKVGGAGTVTALAGCASNSNGNGGTTTGENGGGSGSEPIKIGFLATLSTDLGKGGLRSARMAVDDINSAGGIDGRTVKLVKGDAQASASKASTAVQSMINREGVDAIFGTWVSEVTLGIMDRVANAGTPYFVTGSASPKITANYAGQNYEKYKNFFRVSPFNSNIEADHLADYATFLKNKHGWSKFAVTVEDAAWTKPITNRTPDALKQAGLEVTMNKRFAPKTSDFTPILDKVKNSGADAMLKAIAHVSGTGLLSTWKQNEYPFAQEGINISSMSPHYWADTNGGCRYEATGLSPAGVASITEKTTPFVDAYRKRYSSRPALPMFMGMGTYDAVHIYKNAVERAGTADYQQNLDSIVSALQETDYKGVSGHIRFHGKDSQYPNDVKYGTNAEPFVISQWQKATDGNGIGGTNGTKVAVWDKQYATGDHVAPPWMG